MLGLVVAARIRGRPHILGTRALPHARGSFWSGLAAQTIANLGWTRCRAAPSTLTKPIAQLQLCKNMPYYQHHVACAATPLFSVQFVHLLMRAVDIKIAAIWRDTIESCTLIVTYHLGPFAFVHQEQGPQNATLFVVVWFGKPRPSGPAQVVHGHVEGNRRRYALHCQRSSGMLGLSSQYGSEGAITQRSWCPMSEYDSPQPQVAPKIHTVVWTAAERSTARIHGEDESFLAHTEELYQSCIIDFSLRFFGGAACVCKKMTTVAVVIAVVVVVVAAAVIVIVVGVVVAVLVVA